MRLIDWAATDKKYFSKERDETKHLIEEESLKNSYNINSYNIIEKYSFIVILIVFGLIFVSVVKNETRHLEREINNLKAQNSKIKFNLKQAILDNEVITSPQNISRLAEEHLNIDLVSYKKSQILPLRKLNSVTENPVKNISEENKKLPSIFKLKIAKKVEKKKMEIQKLQELYNNPKLIPSEIKAKVALSIEEKKAQLKNIHESPRDLVTFKKATQWTAVQIVKLFLGIPTLPGR